jgi:hypothetical protein
LKRTHLSSVQQVFSRTFGGRGQQYRWAASPPLSLRPALPAPLAHADVAAAAGATLRVLGSGAEGALQVAEVAGALAALDESG